LGVWADDTIANVSEVLGDEPRFHWARGLSDPVVER
jgi:hypothetical protein